MYNDSMTIVKGVSMFVGSRYHIVRNDRLDGYTGMIDRIRRAVGIIDGISGKALITIKDDDKGYKTIYTDKIRSVELA